MPGFLQEHLRPLAGSAGLHLALLALLAGAALRWTSSQPPVELAIEGYVVDGPVRVKPLPQPRSTSPAAVPPRQEEVQPKPEPAADPVQQQRVEEAVAAERAAQADRERRQVEERAAQARESELAREQAAAEQRSAEEAQAQRKAAEAKRKTEEQAQAERDAEVRAEREADLQRRLAAEEEADAVARSGVMDEYRALLVQTIERNWIRPPSARAGLQCTLHVTQAPGGTVVDVKLGACNGDQAVRESIANAVFRASPLPAPRDPRAFERRLEIVFKPTE